MGFLLQIRMSWLRALSKGCRCWCWCCGPGCWCCELAERAFKAGGGAAALVGCWCGCRCCQLAKRTGAGVSWLCALWRCRKLAVQAAYILVPASCMSTGRGILPSYLGLCWCKLYALSVHFVFFSLRGDCLILLSLWCCCPFSSLFFLSTHWAMFLLILFFCPFGSLSNICIDAVLEPPH